MKPRSIYIITNRVNGKKYVGQTNQPNVRQRQHLKGWSRCLAVNAAVKKHGRAAFDFRVLAIAEDRTTADQVERALIKALKTKAPHGYNLTDGGEGGLCTAEGRRKISLSKIGKPMTNAILASVASRRGKHLRPETIKKISEYRTRWHKDPANKARHSIAVKEGMKRRALADAGRIESILGL